MTQPICVKNSWRLGAALDDIHDEPEPEKDLKSEILQLLDMDILEREQERNRISKEYNIRKSVVDDFVRAFEEKNEVGTSTIVATVTPWEHAVNGEKLLSEINSTIKKHVILHHGAAEAASTWVILTYCFDSFRILPILGVQSPEKRCGKTTFLETLQGLCNKALVASNISSAAVFRTIEKYQPTLLVDEADTFLKDNEELRGVLNSGHTRAGAFVIRVQGDDHEPVRFSTWGPKIIAMIGRLPDTLQDRSILISLRRKAPGEKVARIGIDFEKECLEIRRKCQRWADDNMNRLLMARPTIPETGNDRAADNWYPLLAIADVIGGEWPKLIRKSMSGSINTNDDAIGPKLLADIKQIFQLINRDRIFSDDLVKALKDDEDRPWVDWSRGKGLSQNGLGRLLAPYEITSKTIRIEDKRRKGYELKAFQDAFKRYLLQAHPISSVTTGQANNISNLDQFQSVTSKDNVTVENQDNSLNSLKCHGVTDEKGDSKENIKKEETF